MFIVLLKFSENKAKAAEFMSGHNDWLGRGFSDGVFLLAGSLKPSLGGGILAYNTTRAELERRVNEDPFVTQGIVEPDILEITPSRAGDQLGFLLG
ncbi:MAG: hypothetical protein RO009_20650 [Pseudorhodoplanes sp.]|jgi:uncharacterized protein YciI|nr:hypothetical protein [Pseudorhodoplanes sp.]